MDADDDGTTEADVTVVVLIVEEGEEDEVQFKYSFTASISWGRIQVGGKKP